MVNPKVVFIEGVNDIEIGCFLSCMTDYFKGEGVYAKIVSHERYDSMPPRKREHARKFAFSSPERSRREIELWNLVRRHGIPFSFRQMDMTFGSPESRDFLEKRDQGRLPEGTNIPRELLQAHYDYDNVIKEMGEGHDLLACKRSAMSYYVDIVKGHNRPDLLPVFESFMSQIGQGSHPVWILQTSAQKMQERARDKSGFQKPIEYFEQQQQFYQDAAASGIWSQVSFIDTTSDDVDTYRAIFASLITQMN